MATSLRLHCADASHRVLSREGERRIISHDDGDRLRKDRGLSQALALKWQMKVWTQALQARSTNWNPSLHIAQAHLELLTSGGQMPMLHAAGETRAEPCWRVP